MNFEKLKEGLLVGGGLFDHLKVLVKAKEYSSIFLLTEDSLFELYRDRIRRVFRDELSKGRFFFLPGGEKSKSLESVRKIGEQMLSSGLDRRSLLVALGGGVVTDVGGLTASLFMRGIDFVNVPTTLVAQVDAALGGKCGVNLTSAKNIMGLFSLPKLVLIDPEFLDSLSKDQVNEGMVEVLKIAAVADAELFEKLESIECDISRLNVSDRAELIQRAALLKLRVVTPDFREANHRRILNFGHTTGHALEAFRGYGEFSHGQGVAIGILVASEISEAVCGLNRLVKDRLKALTKKMTKETKLEKISVEEVWSLVQNDKKRDAGQINFTLLTDFGSPIVRPVDEGHFAPAFKKIKQELSR